jgi:glutaconate CoA-transferase subunit B
MTSTNWDYAVAELMACVLAREFNDNELGAIGAASQVAMAAVKLARLQHAPNLSTISGGSGAVNSRLPYLLKSAADYRNLFGAECRVSMEDTVDIEVRGRCDWAAFGAIQVDKYGNMNMIGIGDYAKPKLRGPGTVGLSLTGAFQRYYIYLTHHDRRILVERVDHISGPGFVDGSPERDRLVQPGAMGPCMAVTPLAVFDFEESSRQMRLKSVHPGITVDEVLDKTGFTPIMPDRVPETPPPSATELRLLREIIDTAGVLRSMKH